MKKFLSLFVVFAFAVALLGCDGCNEPEYNDFTSESLTEDVKWEHEGNATTLKQGFTSLENQNANGAIDENGYYEIAGQRIKTKDVYKTVYQTEPTKDLFNYLCNSWTYNSEHYTNMLDGLVENDKYSNIVGALAIGYKNQLNSDGTETWTFQLKEGVAWVNNESGNIAAEVTADDFVAGIKYVLNPANASSTASIVTSLINGSAEYYDALSDGETADFATVGVKAVSKYEVQYTLYQATPYFLSSLTYSPFLPLCEEYLEWIGSDFGTTVNNILVNGAFRITEHVSENKMVYTKNDKYYDAEHVYVNTVEKTFYSADVATETKLREWFEAGIIDSFSVNDTDEAGMNKYVLGADGTGSIQNPADPSCNPILSLGDATYIGYYNFARETYEYTNPDLTKTDAEKAATLAAIQNKNFRKGVLYGLEVMKYLEYYNSENPQEWLMRGYTNRELTAYNGKDYADYVDEVFNAKQGTTGVTLSGINNGSDPVYNAEKAAQFFATAKAELIAAGLTEADFPIKVDVIGSMSERQVGYEEAMYASLEAAGTGVIDVQINYPTSNDQNTQWGSVVNNYDFSMWSGWGPDYADPQTFLQTMVVRGFMVDQLGFTAKDEANIALEKSVLGAYTELFDKAAAIVDVAQTDARYKAFAEAEYALIYEEAIIVPWLTQSGYVANVSKTIPYQAGRATYGLTSDKLKNVVVSDSIITKDIRKAIVDDYNANK